MCMSCSLDRATEISEELDRAAATPQPGAAPPEAPAGRERLDRALHLAEAGQVDAAIEALREIPEHDALHSVAAFNRALLLARLGFTGDAVRLLKPLAHDDEGRAALEECRRAHEQGVRVPACTSRPLRRG